MLPLRPSCPRYVPRALNVFPMPPATLPNPHYSSVLPLFSDALTTLPVPPPTVHVVELQPLDVLPDAVLVQQVRAEVGSVRDALRAQRADERFALLYLKVTVNMSRRYKLSGQYIQPYQLA